MRPASDPRLDGIFIAGKTRTTLTDEETKQLWSEGHLGTPEPDWVRTFPDLPEWHYKSPETDEIVRAFEKLPGDKAAEVLRALVKKGVEIPEPEAEAPDPDIATLLAVFKRKPLTRADALKLARLPPDSDLFAALVRSGVLIAVKRDVASRGQRTLYTRA